MGIWQGDAVLKTIVELGFEDIRKNPWLLEDILSDFVTNSYLKNKYGQKQIDAAREWLANNEVDIVMGMRNDRDRFPCVEITLGGSQEIVEDKTMGDASEFSVTLQPNTIGKPIPYIIKPFTIVSYDPTSGDVILPDTVDLTAIAPGMIMVDPTNSQGFIIGDFIPGGFTITPNVQLSTETFAIVPSKPYYQAKIQHSWFRETYNIGCHSHGEPQVVLWLWSIVKYSLLRYRQGLLEAQGFTESLLNSGGLQENPNFSGPGGELGFSRYITLTGKIQNTWIMTPRRFIENATIANQDSLDGGIKIISNLNSVPGVIDINNELWTTIEDD